MSARSQERLSRAAIYYVAPGGNDAHPGTLSQPWRTIQHAADTLVAGETVYIRAGTYFERVTPQNSGSAGQYITYATYPGETAILDGSGISVPEDEGLFELSDRSYIRVSGLHVTHSAQTGIRAERAGYLIIERNHTRDTGCSGIGIWYGSHHITIEGNEVELACSTGMQEFLTVAGTDTFEVLSNHVHGGDATHRQEGICIKDGSSNGQVHGNHVHDVQAVGIYVDAWNKRTFNIDVFQNVVHDVAASNGLALASESGGRLENIRVYNNVAYNNRYTGLSISRCCAEGSASHPMANIQIMNNTFYHNGRDPWGGGIYVENPEAQGVVLRNNLLSQNLTFQVTLDTAVTLANLTVDHNLIDGYREGEGEIRGSDYVEGDPLLLNPAGADFHLRPGSPAIDRGSSVNAPDVDLDGIPRPQDGNGDGISRHDIGAYERMVQARRLYLPLME